LNLSLSELLKKLASLFWLLKWLKSENKELKTKLNEQEKTNETNLTEIERLRAENKSLKQENLRLKKEKLTVTIDTPDIKKENISSLKNENIKKENQTLIQQNNKLQHEIENPFINYIKWFPNKTRELPEEIKSTRYIWQVKKYYEANDNSESYNFWLNKHNNWNFSLEIDDWWNNTFIKFEEKPNIEQIEFIRKNYKHLETTSFSLAPWDIMTYSLFEKIITNEFDWNYFIANKTELNSSNFKEPKQQIWLYKNWNKTEAIYIEKDDDSSNWKTKYLIEFDNSWTFIDNRESIYCKKFPSYKEIKQAIENWIKKFYSS